MAPIMSVDIKRVGITHLVRGVYQHGLKSMRSLYQSCTSIHMGNERNANNG